LHIHILDRKVIFEPRIVISTGAVTQQNFLECTLYEIAVIVWRRTPLVGYS